jgi:hypothetical protein
MNDPLRQQDLYHLYANIRERLHGIANGNHPDPIKNYIRREMAEELLEYLRNNEAGLNNQVSYKEQWITGEIQNRKDN